MFHPGKWHPGQKSVITDPSRYKLLRCGRKWGKTQTLVSIQMAKAITNECNLHGKDCPNKLTFAYIAPSFKQAKNIVWRDHVDKLLTHFKKEGLPFEKNESELSITFPSGGRFQLFGVENEDGLRGISSWGSVVCDEYDDWQQDIWQFIILPNLLPHRAPVIVAGTPKGEAGIHDMELAEDEDGKRLFTHWHFDSYKNPVIPNEDIEQLAKWAKAKGEDFYQQEIMAEYIRPYGMVYKEFNESRQTSNNVRYDPDLPLHISWDFGVNDPTAIVWLQPDNEGVVRVIDYHEESNASIDHFIQVVNYKPYKKASLHTGDIAGRARSLTTGQSVLDQLKTHGIYVVTNPIPNIEDQIRKTHEMIPRLRITKPTHKQSTTDPAYKGTARFISCLKNYIYPDKEKNPNQPAEKPLHNWASHGMRALEYYAWNRRYTEESMDDDEFPATTVELRKDGFYV